MIVIWYVVKMVLHGEVLADKQKAYLLIEVGLFLYLYVSILTCFETISDSIVYGYSLYVQKFTRLNLSVRV